MDIIKLIENVSGFIWGGTWGDTVVIPGQIGPLAVVLLGTGLFMMVRLGARPILRFVPAVVEVWRGRKAQGEDGAITPWQALSTALSGQGAHSRCPGGRPWTFRWTGCRWTDN